MNYNFSGDQSVLDNMKKEIDRCLAVLHSGGTILCPTDTIWGLGCDATNGLAVDKVFRLKRRSGARSFIILVDSAEKLATYIEQVPEIALDLVRTVEKPLTIVYPGARNLASNVIAGDQTVAIRIVRPGNFCHALLKAYGKPVVSTSANISGESNPLTYKEINPVLLGGVDYVVSEMFGIPEEVKPSQIIKINVNGEFTIIRN
jgi:L-threonylcarbamoyladenylate synthase